MTTNKFELVDQLKEYDDFFDAYGELIIVDGVRLARLGCCTVKYYNGHYDMQAPVKRSRCYGVVVTWRMFYSNLNSLVCDQFKPLGNMSVGIVITEDRRVFGKVVFPGYVGIIDDQAGASMVCEHLLGRETPLLDWLIDNVDEVREFVSQSG